MFTHTTNSVGSFAMGSTKSSAELISRHPKAKQYDFWLSSGSVVFWIIFTGWLYVFLKVSNQLNSRTSDGTISDWESTFLILLPILMYIFLIIYPLGSHIIFDPEVSDHQLRSFLCKRATQHLCIVSVNS